MKLLDNVHIVNGWTHADANGAGLTSDIVSMKNYNRLTIVLDFGNTAPGGDADITISACDDVAGTHSAALNNYSMRKSPGSAADDAFAEEVAIADSKIDYVAGGEIVPNTDDNCLVVVELDGAAVRAASDTYEMDCVQVSIGSPGQSCPVGCKFILSEPRNAGATLPSAIVD
jgi:hypothetical protein